MALTPSGNPIALQDAGTNQSVTTDPILLDRTITVGSTSMNTMQAWTDIAYTPFGGTTYYTTYVKDLTGGNLYGYSPSFSRTAWGFLSPGHGASSSSTLGPSGLLSFHDGTGPTSGSSGSYYSQSSTYSGSGVMGSQPAALFGGGPWGQTPTTASGSSGQFHESFTQTYSYQGRTNNGFGINISNAGTSIGSFGSSAPYDQQYWTGSSGIKWNVQQILWSKNTKSNGAFPNLNGPYNGSHETGSNAGNFVFLFITRSDGQTVSDSVANAYTAEEVFSHLKIGTGTTVFKSHHSGVSHSPGLSGIAPTRYGRAAYTSNSNIGFYYFWQGVADSVIDNLGTTGSRDFEIYGPRTSVTYNNGIAEEHGGNDSADVKASDYIKGGPSGFVAAAHPSNNISSYSTYGSAQINFSDYYGTTKMAGASTTVLGISNSNDTTSGYYQARGAGAQGHDYYYQYQVGNTLRPGFGAFKDGGVNGTVTAAPLRSINNVEQRITFAALQSNPAGFYMMLTMTPTSGNASDVIGPGDFTSFEWKMPSNDPSRQTLTTYETGLTGQYSANIGVTFNTTVTTATVSGQLVPSRHLYWAWPYSTYSSTASNNLGRYWATDGFSSNSSWDRDFEIDFS